MLTWILAGTVVALQVPDIVSTNAILARGGREMNPIIRACMRLGRWWWVPKLAVAVAASWFIAASGSGPESLAGTGATEAVICLAVLNALYVLVVASNLRQLYRLCRVRRLDRLNSLGPGPMRRLHLRLIRSQAKNSQKVTKHMA